MNSKERMAILGIAAVLALFTVPFWSRGIIQTHDGIHHIARIASYSQALSDLHIPPRWAGALNFGYGTPVFSFFYPLPYITGAGISFISLSPALSWKIENAIGFILAGIFFYLWMRDHTLRHRAILGACMYALAPYHFVNLFVRGDIGEIFAYMILPLIGMYTDRLGKKQRAENVLGLSVSLGLLILSHHGVSVIALPIFAAYAAMVGWHNKKTLALYAVAYLFSLWLSAFFWLPAFLEKGYVQNEMFSAQVYRSHFVRLYDIIVYSWGYGDTVGKPGSLSVQAGPIHITILLFTAVTVLYKRVRDMRPYIWLAAACIAVYMMTPWSVLIWEAIPFLRKLQFPWRFIGITAIASAWLSARTLRFSVLHTRILCVLLVILSLRFIQPLGYDMYPDSYYRSFSGSTYYHQEATPVWTAGDPHKPPEYPVAVISGQATIHGYTKKTGLHRFTAQAQGPARLADMTLYYPGWHAYVNESETPVEFQDPNWKGLITFAVPQGRSDITIQWKETKLRLLANTLSLISWGIAVILWSALYYRKRAPV